jgi:hypothetical protein
MSFLAALPAIAQALPSAAGALKGGGSTKVNVSQSQASETLASVNPLILVNAGTGGVSDVAPVGAPVYGGGATARAPLTSNDYQPARGRASIDIPSVVQPVTSARVAQAGGFDLKSLALPVGLALAAYFLFKGGK